MDEIEAQEILDEMWEIEAELLGDFALNDRGRMEWLWARHTELLDLLEEEGWG